LIPLFVTGKQYIAEGRLPLVPLPEQTIKVKNAITDLNGTWEINFSTSSSFWQGNATNGSWQKIFTGLLQLINVIRLS